MKRHLPGVRQLSMCAAVAGFCILGVPSNLLAASEAKAPVSIAVNQGNTFLSNIVSGSASGVWADRTSWQTVFRLGQPSLFGGEYLPALPAFQRLEAGGTLSASTGSPKQVKPAGLSLIKLGGGTLQLSGGIVYSGPLQTANLSGGVLTVSQPLSVPTISSSTDEVEAPVLTGTAVVTSIPAAQPSSEQAAPSTPSRRPKPPLPPGPSPVSR